MGSASNMVKFMHELINNCFYVRLFKNAFDGPISSTFCNLNSLTICKCLMFQFLSHTPLFMLHVCKANHVMSYMYSRRVGDLTNDSSALAFYGYLWIFPDFLCLGRQMAPHYVFMTHYLQTILKYIYAHNGNRN